MDYLHRRGKFSTLTKNNLIVLPAFHKTMTSAETANGLFRMRGSCLQRGFLRLPTLNCEYDTDLPTCQVTKGNIYTIKAKLQCEKRKKRRGSTDKFTLHLNQV